MAPAEKDPFELFETWLKEAEAKEPNDPNAMALATADAQGRYRSEIFPGLWLDAPSLLKEDLAAVLAFGRQGVGSPEHAQFVARLGAAATAK